MSSKKQLHHLLPLTLFICFAAYILVGRFGDVLYTAQDRNEFFSSGQYFTQCMQEPFGLMSYLGRYLMQYFYYPALGAALLILIWCAVYGAAVKAFALDRKDAPVNLRVLALLLPVCLLASCVNMGYWIYILPLRGYFFSQSLACLAMLLLLWAARSTSPRLRGCWYLVNTLILFPLLGWVSLFFALCLFVMQCVEPADNRSPWWQPAVGMLLTGLTPFLWARILYADMHICEVWKAGVPYFQSTTVDALRPSYPFILLVAFTLLLLVSRVWRTAVKDATLQTATNHKPLWINRFCVPELLVVLITAATTQFYFTDYNYQAEMRMNRAAMEDDWQTIIREAEKADAPSRTMVVLKNIALMNTGELGNRTFMLDNSGLDICNPDSLNLNVMQIAVPIIYFDYGKVQFATRWCMENAVGYGFSPYYLKLFVRASQETGENAVMQRYLKLLSLTTFHGDWRPLPPTQVVRGLHVAFSDVIDSDNNDCERYLIQNFSLAFGSSNPLVKELNLFYAMIYRDPQYFWPAFHAFASMTGGANIPLHYQEAYLIMQENYGVNLPYKVQISPAVQQNYKLYKQSVVQRQQAGMSEAEVGEVLRPSWKHTYWWYLMYGRKVY